MADGWWGAANYGLLVAERWSQQCQSNWPLADNAQPCYYGNNSTSCDDWTVCAGYQGGCDSRTYYASNETIGAYGQMLYGGQGTSCVLASATHQFEVGNPDYASWHAEQCV